MLARLMRPIDAVAAHRRLARFLALFLPVATVYVMCVVLVQGGVQHDYRSSADDPQIQVAQDAAQKLDAGATPASLVGPQKVNLAQSLAVHVTVYDTSGSVVASDASLDGETPTIPKGVLDTARSNGEDRVTWQPRGGIRVAALAVPWHGGTVLAGRSLERVERRVDDLNVLCIAALVVGLGVLGLVSFVVARLAHGPGAAGSTSGA